MACFNFDALTNIDNSKIPSVKAINKELFRERENKAGLWIADENLENAKWKKDCVSSCSPTCNEHYKNTKYHSINITTKAGMEQIPGRGILNPRIIVLHRSPLLKLLNEIKNKRYLGLWQKGDGNIMDKDNKKKFICARRYLLIFVDEKNKPLHEEPIQLTATGNFQFSFDTQLSEFRDKIKTAYCKQMSRPNGRVKNEWYAMCVFVPTFISKPVGKDNAQSLACLVDNYEIPTESNWLNYCVGRNMEVNEFVYCRYMETEKWIQKYSKETQSLENIDSASMISGYSG